jgi:peptidoglycan/LPS O-acetylase OafA/YrhL
LDSAERSQERHEESAQREPGSTLKPAGAGAGQKLAALDGLRGLAVLAVLVFHLSWSFPEVGKLALFKNFLWSGWIGVDLFFVLSGFLITRGLVKDSRRSVGERMKLFWARRATRIFPLYYLVLAAGTVVCLAMAREHLPSLSYWLYTQNYTLAFDPVPLRWTAHFWSLAIEEQFYFVWPLFMLLAPKWKRVSIGIVLLVFCILLRTGLLLGLPKVASLGWDTEQIAKVVYRATLTHMDGLLFGALLAMLDEEKESALALAWARVRKPAFYVSFATLLLLIVATKGFGTYDRRVMLVGYPVMALAFGAAVSLGAHGEFSAGVQRVLSNGLLPAVGKISYGMYIFHWFLVVFLSPMQEEWNKGQSAAVATLAGFAFIVGGIAVTYAVAWCSFRWVEAPFLKLKEKFHE